MYTSQFENGQFHISAKCFESHTSYFKSGNPNRSKQHVMKYYKLLDIFILAKLTMINSTILSTVSNLMRHTLRVEI